MLQIAAPSREDVAAYRRLRHELDAAPGSTVMENAIRNSINGILAATRRHYIRIGVTYAAAISLIAVSQSISSNSPSARRRRGRVSRPVLPFW